LVRYRTRPAARTGDLRQFVEGCRNLKLCKSGCPRSVTLGADSPRCCNLRPGVASQGLSLQAVHVQRMRPSEKQPLRADSPRCCSGQQPGCGSPHPPAGVSALQRPDATGRWGGPRTNCRLAHQRSSPAKSRLLLGRPSMLT
jgi:hypothetical protein